MANESICAEFPRRWEDFIDYYAETPPEGGDKRVPVYRVMQMMCYYVENNYLKIGAEYSTNDFEVIFAADPTCDLRSGSPRFRIVRRGVEWLV